MARRALKEINWPKMLEKLSETDRNVFAAFKSKSDQYRQRVMELPESPVKIDWAFYKQKIPVAGMVDTFQKEYEALKIPFPADSYTSVIEAEGQQAVAEAKSFVEECNSRIAEYQEKIQKLESLLPFEQMTMEDFAEAYPEHTFNVDKPTIWPHIPEDQPGDEPEPIPKRDH